MMIQSTALFMKLSPVKFDSQFDNFRTAELQLHNHAQWGC
jgi:hypothetical protein